MSILSLWPALPALLIAFGLHWGYEGLIVKPAQEASLKALEGRLVDQCNADKKLTEDASNDYQAKITALNRHVSALKLRKPARCVPVAVSPRGANAATSTGKLLGPYGISSEWAFEYAGDAEQTRLQLIGLQDFVRKVWGR